MNPRITFHDISPSTFLWLVTSNPSQEHDQMLSGNSARVIVTVATYGDVLADFPEMVATYEAEGGCPSDFPVYLLRVEFGNGTEENCVLSLQNALGDATAHINKFVAAFSK